MKNYIGTIEESSSMNEYTQNKQIKKSIQRIEDALKKIRRKWNEYFSTAFETELKRKN